MEEDYNPNTIAPTRNTNIEEIAVITPVVERNQGTNAPPTSPQTEGQETPPRLREAQDYIGDYKFDPSLGEAEIEAERQRTEEEAIATALVMFSPTAAAVELPNLQTEPWPYAGKKPDPITIGTAKKLLAAAYANIPCEYEAAGDHGYAWMIENDDTWLERSGVSAIVAPSKPKEVTSFDMRAQFEYAVKSKRYGMYKHLCQEGKAKITEWFGKEMFVDLFVKGVLPPNVTPKELLEHIATTYATPHSNRICMETVEEQINGPFEASEPVEAYFMRLQEARAHAQMLGIDYTDPQIMNKALKQFELRYDKDAYKAEKRWNEQTEKTSWTDFKNYWKEQVHQWSMYATRGSKKKYANEAIDVQSLVSDVSALQAEAKTLQENNSQLIAQLQFHQALQTEHTQKEDDISTITTQLSGLQRQLENMRIPGFADGCIRTDNTSDSGTRTRAQELLHIAHNRNPRHYSNANDGKGKRFSSYCWKCGCNCTHWTKKCLELTGSERKKYRDADFDNTMGGSTKFLDRRGKYQSDYNFDSL